MTHDQDTSPAARSIWQVLLRVRWVLGGAIGLAFALGQLLEALFFGPAVSTQRLVLDLIGWGLLGGLAVWFSLSWASRQERRHAIGLAEALQEQQQLNRQLARSNSLLALLSDVNRQIGESATVDEISSAALQFPQRLLPVKAAALLLATPAGMVEARASGASAAQLASWRRSLGRDDVTPPDSQPRWLRPADPAAMCCLVLPLFDGVASIGRIELFVEPGLTVPDDELALLQTIGSEIAEAIMSARRRSREERALYELERAIAEERARIARDIHDGIAQTLAFRRMRIDLWLDWLDTDRERLRAELVENKQVLREQIAELRRAIFALRPVQFDDLGFSGGMQRYIAEFAAQYSWQVEVDVARTPEALTPEYEAICFRIVQEALTNVAKHAGARTVRVRIAEADGGLAITVQDDGGGFDLASAMEQTGHVGLRQMQERARAVHGRMTVLSRPGTGTEIRVWLPRHSEARERLPT